MGLGVEVVNIMMWERTKKTTKLRLKFKRKDNSGSWWIQLLRASCRM